jgi:hypothetical protein
MTDVKLEYYDLHHGKLSRTRIAEYGDYDEHGNWTRSTQYFTQNQGENSITARKITYHE